MRIAIVLGALVVAAALVGLLVLSRDSPQSPSSPAAPRINDAATVQDAHIALQPVVRGQDAPVVTEDSPQLRAVRASGTAAEPWAADAAALVAKLAPGASTTCFVAGCIVELASPSTAEATERAFAADTTWTGGKQWIGTTLVLYRPD